MSLPAPHFLMFSEARPHQKPSLSGDPIGEWRFVLESVDGASRLEASGGESETDHERLELLAVVRGLEALDQPSIITLLTRNHGLSRGLRFGLDHWRENHWRWERFGNRVLIKDADLWQRVNHALQFHKLECRVLRFDAPHPVETPWMNSRGLACQRQNRRKAREVAGTLARWTWGLVTLPSHLLGGRKGRSCAA